MLGNVSGHREALEFELTPLGSTSVTGTAEIGVTTIVDEKDASATALVRRLMAVKAR